MALAAPEIVALAAFACMFFLVFLYYAYGYSIGALLEWLVARIKSLPSINLKVTTISFDFLAVPFESADNAVRFALGKGIDATRATGLYMWHWMSYVFDEIGGLLDELAHTTERAISHALRIHIPAFVNNRIRWLTAHVAALEHAITALPHRAEVIIQRPVRVIRTEITKVARAAIAIPLPRIGRLEREAGALADRLKSLARRFGPAAVIGTVALAVGRLGFGWVRCAKVGRTGKQLCGMDDSLLESLLADTLIIAGTVSLVEFAEGMQGITAEVAPVIRTFWRAT